MTRKSRIPALLCMLVPVGAPACAGNGDAVSRQLIAVAHHVGEPSGTLAVEDDGRWSFLVSSAKTQTQGVLSSAELSELEVHLERPRLQALYAEKSQDDDRCAQLEDGYVIMSKGGTACFVMSDELTPKTRADLDYFVALFSDHSNKTQ